MTNPDTKPDTQPDASPSKFGTSTHEPDASTKTQVAPGRADGPPGPRRVGPYRLIRSLGRGAFGEVWLAEHVGSVLERVWAVKIPHAAQMDTAAVTREAKLWFAAGEHPNVLPLHDAAVYDAQIVIVSKYAEGGSLAEWLARQGGTAPPVEQAVEMIGGVLDGLEHVHTRGILHRDIKPANILLQNGCPQLADFGLARGLGVEQSSNAPSGTPAYMAPEAFDGVRSRQTDIWSVGVLLYRLLTGRLPFPRDGGALAGDAWARTLKSVLVDTPDPLPASIPAECRAAVDGALVKDPHGRFKSAADMRAVLRSGARPVAPPTPNEPLVVSAVAMFLMPIPAGEFAMGSAADDPTGYLEERPRHTVTISKPFWLGVAPVTQKQFVEVMGFNPSRFDADRSPVEQVTWLQAVEFCNRLSEREGLDPYYTTSESGEVSRKGGGGFRLPTEAEWEYACRAGTTDVRWFPPADLGRFAWHRGNAGGRTRSAGRLEPNRWGLRDMLGNVWEWCWDRYLETYYLESPKADPAGPARGRNRVLRGGSFGDQASVLRCANRFSLPTTGKLDNAGFRIARDAG